MIVDTVLVFQSRSSEKKLVKPLKKIFFWTQIAQKRCHYDGPCPIWKIFLAEIKKVDHQLSESWFLFYQNICFG